nr:immunoglobulin light chain junction region [Mus musculus]
CSQSTHVPFTF